MNWYEPDDEVREMWAAWYAERPAPIVKLAKRFAPWTLWRLDHGKGRRVFVRSFQEMEDGSVTLTVIVSGQFNAVLMERSVFGVDPETLVESDLPAPDELVGNAGLHPDQVIRASKREQN